MTLQNRLKELYKPFLSLNCDVRHYTRQSKYPYMVWSEDGEDNSFHTSNHKAEQQITGVIDYFTKKEFDSIVDDIQAILNSEEIGWSLSSIQYEDETNLIHYQWRWWDG